MWIYDGEDWIEEGVDKREKKTDQPESGGQFYPELEIIEIPNTDRVPPPPMP